MAVEATAVIEFNGSDDTEYVFNYSLDDTLNRDEEGEVKSSFQPGDSFYVWINYSDNIVLDNVVITHGNISNIGQSTRSKTEDMLFTSRTDLNPSTVTISESMITENSRSFLGRDGIPQRELNDIGQSTYVSGLSHTPYRMRINYSFGITSFLVHSPNVALGEDESYPITIVYYFSEAS